MQGPPKGWGLGRNGTALTRRRQLVMSVTIQPVFLNCAYTLFEVSDKLLQPTAYLWGSATAVYCSNKVSWRYCEMTHIKLTNTGSDTVRDIQVFSLYSHIL